MRQTLEEISKQNSRSLNAEILPRLEESLAGKTMPEGLPTADEARKLAEQARAHLKETAREYIAEQIRNAIQRGAVSTSINFGIFINIGDIDDQFTDPISNEIIHPLIEELDKARYTVEHLDLLTYTVDF